MRLLFVITLMYVMGLLACSTTKGGYAKNTSYSRDYIYREEIQNNAATNAYGLIRSLRPHWLQGRGAKSVRYAEASYAVVYVDGSRRGDINSLSTVFTENIAVIQFLNASDAIIRFGPDHPGGAILITLR